MHFDQLDEVRVVGVWLVRANVRMDVQDLLEGVVARLQEFEKKGHKPYYGWTVLESDRRRLLSLAAAPRLTELPDLTVNPGGLDPSGHLYLNPGGQMIFVHISLPVIDPAEPDFLGAEVVVTLPLRELDFLVNDESFERLFDTPWASYLQEFGGEPGELRIQEAFSPSQLRPLHFQTLKFLVERIVSERVPEGAAYFGNLFLFNQTTIDMLPSAARAFPDKETSDTTRSLDDSQRFGRWKHDWIGGYIYTILRPTPEQLAVARFRPLARKVADRLGAWLQSDSTGQSSYEVYNILKEAYGDGHSLWPSSGGSPFEFLLTELIARGVFDRFFDRVETAGLWDLLALVIRLTLGTRYSQNARFLRTVEVINSQRRANQNHLYRVSEKEIWLDHNSSQPFKVGMVAAEVDSIYSSIKKVQRLKAAKLEELKKATGEEMDKLLGKIVRGEESRQFDQDTFAKAALEEALKHVPVGKDDVEEIKVERSIRLTGLESRVEEGIERFYITYHFVERIVGVSEWSDLEDTKGPPVLDSDFEWLLWAWKFNKTAAVTVAFAQGVSILAVVVVAFEVGAVALLVRIAGGTANVVISITLSEAIYLLKVIFGDARLTTEGLLIAALDGYLMALSFHGAGLLGRALAKSIGTETVKRLVGGWVLERLAVGAVGGAGSAALETFAHDLLKIASGDGSWSKLSEYVNNMSWGACLGVVFEFGIGALQPILKAGGRTGLETIDQVVQGRQGHWVYPGELEHGDGRGAGKDVGEPRKGTRAWTGEADLGGVPRANLAGRRAAGRWPASE